MNLRLVQVDDEFLKNSQECEGSLVGHCGYLSQFRKLMERHGKGVLYRGLVPVVTAMALSNFVYFYAYNALKNVLSEYKKKTGRDISSVGMLGISTLAGIINVLLTTPLWVAATRSKLSHRLPPPPPSSSDLADPSLASGGHHQAPMDLLTVMARIHQEEGWKALWSGTLPSLLLVCNPVIQFFLYDHLKAWRLGLSRGNSGGRPLGRVQLSLNEAFLFGAISKGLATVLSYPLQVGYHVYQPPQP